MVPLGKARAVCRLQFPRNALISVARWEGATRTREASFHRRLSSDPCAFRHGGNMRPALSLTSFAAFSALLLLLPGATGADTTAPTERFDPSGITNATAKQRAPAWGNAQHERPPRVENDAYEAALILGALRLTTRPETPNAASITLRPRTVSFGAEETDLGSPTDVTATDQALVATYSDGVSVTYMALPSGVEISVQLDTIPNHIPGDLVLDFDLNTTLQPVTTGDPDTERILFLQSGSPAIFIAGLRAWDAQGAEVEPHGALSNGRYSIRIPHSWIKSAKAPVLIDPFVGNARERDGRVNSATWPALSYSTDTSEYLLIYEYEYAAGDHDILARRLDEHAEPVGGTFPVSNSVRDERTPRIAYDQSYERYLVVYTVPDDPGSRVVGRRLSSTGALIGDEIPISPAADSYFEETPYVASDGQRYFLVTYHSCPADSGDCDIWSVRVSAYDGDIESRTQITTHSADDKFPTLAYSDAAHDEYLVTWQRCMEGTNCGDYDDWDIYAQRVDRWNNKQPPADIHIAATPYPETQPDTAFDILNDRYVVVYERYYGGLNEIRDRMVRVDGTLPSFSEEIYRGPDSSYAPRVSSNSTSTGEGGGSFVLAFTNSFASSTDRFQIHAFTLDGYDGTPNESLPDYTESWIPNNGVGPYPNKPAIAYDANLQRHLITWEDYRESGNPSGPYDIYARLFHYDGRLPDCEDDDGDGEPGCYGDCRNRSGSPCDCDDGEETVYHGAPQLCDGVNNDCDTGGPDGNVPDDEIDDDGDSFVECTPWEGSSDLSGGDCDDSDSAVHPAATELCDGLDNDCDNSIDEEPDVDGDGYSQCSDDCDDSDPERWKDCEEDHFGQQEDEPQGGDPVNLVTGNYYLQKTDIEVPCQGPDFVFERTYNAQDAAGDGSAEDPYLGPLGYGWTHRYNIRLEETSPDGPVRIKWGDGHEATYSPAADGSYQPPYGSHNTLTENPDGTFTLTIKETKIDYDFTADGALDRIVDRNGNAVDCEYAGGNLTAIVDATGRRFELSYTPDGLVGSLTDPIGRQVTFSYDGAQNLVSVTDPRGNAESYEYDSSHQLVRAYNRRGNLVVSNVYDDQRRVVESQSDVYDNSWLYAYHKDQNYTILTDPLGNEHKYVYNEHGQTIEEVDPLGHKALYAYNDRGDRTAVTDRNGHTTHFAYDSRGNVIERTDALGHTRQAQYDADDNLVEQTDEAGNVWSYAYDAAGNLIEETNPLGQTTTYTYNTDGLMTATTDARGHTTEHEYDQNGNRTLTRDPLGHEITHTYDDISRRTSTTNARGYSTTFTYDANGNLTKEELPAGRTKAYQYDSNDNRICYTDPATYAESPDTCTESFEYDLRDRLTTVTDALGHSTRYEYDGLDRRTALIDKRGHRTEYTLDPMGNRTAVKHPDGTTTTYVYDANGNRTQTTDPANRTTYFVYDALNRVVDTYDDLDHHITKTYDSRGNLTHETNPRDLTTTYEYDALSRLTRVTDPAGGSVSYVYDAVGNLIEEEERGHITSYEYDALNRRTLKTDPIGNEFRTVYDANGNVVETIDGNGDSIVRAYDSADRLTTKTLPSKTVDYSYDLNDRLVETVEPLGTTTQEFDALNRLISRNDVHGNTVSYEYDPAGNRTTLGYGEGKKVSYAFDSMNRMSTVTDWDGRVTSYQYDPAGLLKREDLPNGCVVEYAYDEAGRLIRKTDYDAAGDIILDYSYTLDPNGNPLQANVVTPGDPGLSAIDEEYIYNSANEIVSGKDSDFQHDDNGNWAHSLQDSVSRHFEYSAQNQLLTVKRDENANTVSISYDAMGQRVLRETSEESTHYLVDTGASLAQVLRRLPSASPAELSAYGHGLLYTVNADGTDWKAYHYDPQGSAAAITDASGRILDSLTLTPFGMLTDRAERPRHTFMARYGIDCSSQGICYFRDRYYDVKTGRFLSRDPFRGSVLVTNSLNPYLYAMQNPLVYADPSGQTVFAIGLSFLAGAKVAVGAEALLLVDTSASSVDQAVGLMGKFELGAGAGFSGSLKVAGCMSCTLKDMIGFGADLNIGLGAPGFGAESVTTYDGGGINQWLALTAGFKTEAHLTLGGTYTSYLKEVVEAYAVASAVEELAAANLLEEQLRAIRERTAGLSDYDNGTLERLLSELEEVPDILREFSKRWGVGREK